METDVYVCVHCVVEDSTLLSSQYSTQSLCFLIGKQQLTNELGTHKKINLQLHYYYIT